MNDTDDRLR